MLEGHHGTATPRLLRRLNASRVLDALRHSEPMRITDLVAKTHLSRPTVDAVADDLLRLGWLTEIEGDPGAKPARGRPARRVAFHADAGHVLGLDIGERKVRAAVADLSGDIIAESEEAFERLELDVQERLAVVRRLATLNLKAAGVRRDDLLASCVGCTGAMDAAGKVLFSSVFPAGFDLRTAFQRSLGRPVLVENDCNLAVLAEHWRGVARGVDDVICVLAGERLGAGILVGGRLVRGHAGAAGEMAFLGAYEHEHGAEGVGRLIRTLGAEAVRSGRIDTTPGTADGWGTIVGDPTRLEAETVVDAARAGDPVAADIVERSLSAAGRAIVTMALVLNPELVVIGGGVAKAGDVLLEPLRRRLQQMARLPPRLEVSALAERGVVVGAIRHALDDVELRLLDGLHEAA
jgi:predicted NBD/HSP70 family sugar kinase